MGDLRGGSHTPYYILTNRTGAREATDQADLLANAEPHRRGLFIDRRPAVRVQYLSSAPTSPEPYPRTSLHHPLEPRLGRILSSHSFPSDPSTRLLVLASRGYKKRRTASWASPTPALAQQLARPPEQADDSHPRSRASGPSRLEGRLCCDLLTGELRVMRRAGQQATSRGARQRAGRRRRDNSRARRRERASEVRAVQHL